MKSFLQRHAAKITGVLSGFDRLRLRGTIRWLANCPGMLVFLSSVGVLLKEFKAYALDVTSTVRQRTQELAVRSGRKVIYLESSLFSKEEVARAIAKSEGIREGLIAVLSCVEPCWTYTVGPSRESKLLELRGGLKVFALLLLLPGSAFWIHARALADVVSVHDPRMYQRSGMAGTATGCGRD